MSDFTADSEATLSNESDYGQEIQEPCLFPILNNAVHTKSHRRELPVQLPAPTELLLYAKSQLHTAAIVQAAWCMVLNKYLGTNTISFGYLRSLVKSNLHDVFDAEYLPHLHSLVCNIVLNQSDTFEGVVQDLKSQLAASFSSSRCSTSSINPVFREEVGTLFNTIVTWTECLEDGLLDENFASMLQVGQDVFSQVQPLSTRATMR